MFPDAFSAGAAEARIDYLARLEITDEDLRDHFGPAWASVLTLNTEIVTIPYATWLDRAAELAPIRTAQRNASWLVLRDRARQSGLYRNWHAARELASGHFQMYLSDPGRGVMSTAISVALSSADTISRDAMAVTVFGGIDYPSGFAHHLDRLMAPWRAVIGSDSERGTHAAAISTSGVVEEQPAPDDFEPDLNEYDPRLEDPVIDD